MDGWMDGWMDAGREGGIGGWMDIKDATEKEVQVAKQ